MMSAGTQGSGFAAAKFLEAAGIPRPVSGHMSQVSNPMVEEVRNDQIGTDPRKLGVLTLLTELSVESLPVNCTQLSMMMSCLTDRPKVALKRDHQDPRQIHSGPMSKGRCVMRA